MREAGSKFWGPEEKEEAYLKFDKVFIPKAFLFLLFVVVVVVWSRLVSGYKQFG